VNFLYKLSLARINLRSFKEMEISGFVQIWTDPDLGDSKSDHHTIVGDRKAKMTPTKRKIVNNSSIFEEPGFFFQAREGSYGALNVHLGAL
jgi:hypothetical protein